MVVRHPAKLTSHISKSTYATLYKHSSFSAREHSSMPDVAEYRVTNWP